eukprot:863147-Prymnesium_polylepis.1
MNEVFKFAGERILSESGGDESSDTATRGADTPASRLTMLTENMTLADAKATVSNLVENLTDMSADQVKDWVKDNLIGVFAVILLFLRADDSFCKLGVRSHKMAHTVAMSCALAIMSKLSIPGGQNLLQPGATSSEARKEAGAAIRQILVEVEKNPDGDLIARRVGALPARCLVVAIALGWL